MTAAAGTRVPADTSSTHAAPLRHMEPPSFAKASDHLAGERSRATPKPRITLGSVCPPDTETIQDDGTTRCAQPEHQEPNPVTTRPPVTCVPPPPPHAKYQPIWMLRGVLG